MASTQVLGPTASEAAAPSAVVWINGRQAFVALMSHDGHISTCEISRGWLTRSSYLVQVVRVIGDRQRLVILGREQPGAGLGARDHADLAQFAEQFLHQRIGQQGLEQQDFVRVQPATGPALLGEAAEQPQQPIEFEAFGQSHRRRLVGEPPPQPSFEDGVADRSSLWDAVAALPPRQRAVIVLRYYEDLSEAQIAEALGCAAGTVKSQASSGIAALRRAAAAAGVGEAVDGS